MLAERKDALARLAIVMARYRRRVIAGWLIAVAIGLFGLPHLLGTVVAPTIEVAGSESQQASEVLGEALPTLGNESMIAVLHSPALRATDPAFQHAITAGVVALGDQDGISGALLFPLADDPDTALASGMEPLRPLFHDEHTAYVLVGTSGDDRQRQGRLPAQQAAIDQATRGASGDAVRAYLVGASGIGQGLQQAEVEDLMRIELVAVPIAILVLLLGLRAPVAALVPMVIACASVVTTLGLFALLSPVFSVDGMLLIEVGATGLGIGVDYALFVTSRYREELAAGAGPAQAIATAAATTGRTVVYSGLILALACTSLFLMRWHIFAQAAVGTMAVVAVTLAGSVSLLPAVLVSLTERLEYQPRWLARRAPLIDGPAGGGAWLARWADHLMRHPWPYAIAVTAGLLLAATPMPDMTLGFNAERHALADTTYRAGGAIIERDIPGLASPVTIVLRRPADSAEPDTGPLLTALSADPEVAVATTFGNGVDLTAVIAIPKHIPNSPAVIELVHRVRTQIVPAAAPPGLPVLVGGPSALMADILTETSAHLWWVVGCVLALMFAVLVGVLRSLLLPLKALVMSLLATGAAFGLTVLVFQRDGGADLTTDGMIWPQVPLIVFVVLFGLSTDYELFLVRRIQEEYRITGDNRASVVAGLRRTARPISLAAVILAVGFGSLLVSRISGMREIGFTIAMALIIDATVIRLILVPALMQIMGRWNWWFPRIGTR
ncbi:MMPL family transporter [Nocardia sp. NPDC050175]|uniref:MMPL family transporter n=1 Tax=Nocardia sp. NPDC050175 TaxID=3364317 RepID=UPI00378E4D7C